MRQTTVYQTDTSDMLIPHGMFRATFAGGPPLIEAVQAGDTEQAATVHSYFDNVLRFLDAHHGGEDAIVWPVLAERCPQAAELLTRMEREHASIHELRDGAGGALDAWCVTAHPEQARGLIAALNALGAAMEQHFVEEEREILPLASANMSPEEWGALPGHAMQHFTGDKVWLILGLILEQMSDEQRDMTLRLLPPPAVEMWTGMGNAAFDDFVARVRQTARP